MVEKGQKRAKNKRQSRFEISIIKEKGYYFKNLDIGKFSYKNQFDFDPSYLQRESSESNNICNHLECLEKSHSTDGCFI